MVSFFRTALVCLIISVSASVVFGEQDSSNPNSSVSQGDSSIDKLPFAIPVLSLDAAQKANDEALYWIAKTRTVSQAIIDDDTAGSEPMVVPVISGEDALKANQEAIKFQRNELAKRWFWGLLSGMKKHANTFSFIFALLPLMFICDVFRKKKNANSKKRLSSIFSLQRRLLILTSVSLFVFGITVFVPWSVYFGNSSQMSFIFQDFLRENLVLMSSAIIILCCIFLVIPAMISNYLVAIVAGLGLCIYCQSMFMNFFLGEMNGTEPEWDQHLLWGAVNIIIWAVIALAPLAVKMLCRVQWARIISLTAGAFLLLEIIAVSSMVVSASENVWARYDDLYYDGSKQLQFSEEKNIIVFVFDQLGGGLVKPCLDADPQLYETMKDFTWYTDALAEHFSTFPGILHEITGVHSLFPAKDLDDLFEKTWHSAATKSFYEQIRKAGYDSRFYIRSLDMIGNSKYFYNYFTNIRKDNIEYVVDKEGLFQCLTQISGFSAMPYLLKKHFFYGDDFSHGLVEQKVSNSKKTATRIPSRNDTYYKMLSSGISVDADQPVFSIHYTRGAHAPRCVDEKCQYHEPVFEDIMPGARSCFFLLAELIRQLKENNIYDNTCIVLFSDHDSRSEYDSRAGLMSLMIKPFFEDNQEIKKDDRRISSVDILPTLLQIANKDGDFSLFEGFPASDIPSDRIRKGYVLCNHPDILPFKDYNGIPMRSNCFREHILDFGENFTWRKSFTHLIPLNQNAVVDDKVLKEFITINH